MNDPVIEQNMKLMRENSQYIKLFSAAQKLDMWVDDRHLLGDGPITLTLYKQDWREFKEVLRNLKN